MRGQATSPRGPRRDAPVRVPVLVFVRDIEVVHFAPASEWSSSFLWAYARARSDEFRVPIRPFDERRGDRQERSPVRRSRIKGARRSPCSMRAPECYRAACRGCPIILCRWNTSRSKESLFVAWAIRECDDQDGWPPKDTSGRTNPEGTARPRFDGLPRAHTGPATLTRGNMTVGSQWGDHLHGQWFPLGVHTGDHDGVHTGDHVRGPSPAPREAAAHRGCKGIRWYPRLACPQAGRHIGADCVASACPAAARSPPLSFSAPRHLTSLICLFYFLLPILARALGLVPPFPSAVAGMRGPGRRPAETRNGRGNL